MTKRMLIDATHAEETRVVVLDGNRLDEFDVETSTKRQIKSNIYLAKVVRVEPSLQAAFVEYGGNRHGFLAFGEIHPDYYQIPVADRQRLIEQQAEEARREEEEDDRAAAEGRAPEYAETGDAETGDAETGDAETGEVETGEVETGDGETGEGKTGLDASSAQPDAAPHGHEIAADERPPTQDDPEGPEASSAAQPAAIPDDRIDGPPAEYPHAEVAVERASSLDAEPDDAWVIEPFAPEPFAPESFAAPEPSIDPADPASDAPPVQALHEDEPEDDGHAENEPAADLPPVHSIGGADDTVDDTRGRRAPSRALRSYKIQEVIKRRQILLVQVVKEERGGKGAALTTYISLAGRYCVLMPNSPRGGGVSRKITSVADRRRLKEVTADLDLPRGMGLIVRTAGAARPKPEIMRDGEYLLRLWDDIRELTLRSMAPALIYEEASLIKRAIRDVYSRDVDEILVDGEEGWRAARNFMATLIPSHARKVQLWNGESGQKLFARHAVDAQLDAMLSPTVQLKSGGYLVINQTEALVAIDVNSGRSTRERGIEETALRTNMEAADEVARQLRLRDLAGLIVIDFIDMESKRNNAAVERRLKDALKHDRARIQLGTISHFGLMEMSRQRLRPSLAETSFLPCPHCAGTGLVRSTENAAIHVLRAIEEEGAKRRSAEITVFAATSIALYLLNNKRDRLADIEARYGMRVLFGADEALIPPDIRIDRVRPLLPGDLPPQRIAAPPVATARVVEEPPIAEADADDEDMRDEEAADAPRPGETAEESDQRGRRRRRRRRGGRREDQPAIGVAPIAADGDASDAEHIEGVPERVEAEAGEAEAALGEAATPTEAAPDSVSEEERRRRRNRRGGRRRRPADEVSPSVSAPGAEQPDVPVYAGPTPADPFGGVAFDIFDVMDQVEQAALRTDGTAPRGAEPAPASDAMASPVETATPLEAAPDDAPTLAEPLGEPAPHLADETPLPHAIEPVAEPGAESAAQSEPAVEAQELPPTIPPVIIEGAAEPTERKRGWWRR